MIIVTGAAGFIGSCLVARLNQMGERDVLVVDALDHSDKWRNLRNLDFRDYLDRDRLWEFLAANSDSGKIESVIHLGACSDTTETDSAFLMENNYRYTLRLARHCLEHGIRFIYASSAATYGDGEIGYEDDESATYKLMPLNMYGYSKQVFDLKARREGWFDRIAGLKFFNVYGPNEYHKGNMTSVIYKAFCQINECGRVKLFKSHREDYRDGGQQRDFVYVKDAVEVMTWLIETPKVNGLFNLGTGQARSFKDLAQAVFKAMERTPEIEYIDMPVEIRDRYQYFTQADMHKLKGSGYAKPFFSVEEGVADYVKRYLARDFKHFESS